MTGLYGDSSHGQGACLGCASNVGHFSLWCLDIGCQWDSGAVMELYAIVPDRHRCAGRGGEGGGGSMIQGVRYAREGSPSSVASVRSRLRSG